MPRLFSIGVASVSFVAIVPRYQKDIVNDMLPGNAYLSLIVWGLMTFSV